MTVTYTHVVAFALGIVVFMLTCIWIGWRLADIILVDILPKF